MKEYKQNITIPFLTFFTYIFIIMMPILMVFWMIIAPSKILDTLLIIPYCLICLFLLYFLAYIVDLFGKISKKHIVKIDNEKIYYDDKEIKYEFVDKIIFEKGFINKYNIKSTCSALILFNKDQVLLNIKNPSLRLIHILNKNIKNTKIECINKKFLITLICIYGLVFLIWLIVFLVLL